MAGNILAPRWDFSAAPINDTEIALLGGCCNEGYSSEVILFDTKTKECKNMINCHKYGFWAAKNQCIKAKSNQVVALVKDGKREEPYLISWTKGAPIITIIKKF